MCSRHWMTRSWEVSKVSECYCEHDCFTMEENQDEFRMWQGLVGPTFFPTVDANGNISWTNNGGLPNPVTQNIRGPEGHGCEISGIVASASELPVSAPQGTMYAVGTEEPYDAYCYLGEWVNLGLIFPQGPVGPQGPIGITPNLQIGTVETGDTGEPAEASITGTPENPLLNLKLPKGDAATAEAHINDHDNNKMWSVAQEVRDGFLIETFTEVIT